MLRQSAIESLSLDWSGLALGHALRRALALVLLLLGAFAFKLPELALFSIVGAVVVGFGSIRALGSSRATPMLFASLGIAFATFLGSVTSAHAGLTVAAIALAGIAYGFLSAAGPGTAWVSLNCLVFFLVLGIPFPAPPSLAAYHAVLVLAGGLLQTAVLTIFYQVRRRLGRAHASPWFMKRDDLMRATRRALESFFYGPKLGTEALAYGLRMALMLEAGYGVSLWLHLPRASWILMTTALVLKPDLAQTLSRGLGRCLGTLAGGLLTTALVWILQPSPMLLLALMILSASAAYLFFYVNYALCTVFITAYIVFLLSFEGLPGPEIAYRRAVATLLGGMFACLAHFPWRIRPGRLRAHAKS